MQVGDLAFNRVVARRRSGIGSAGGAYRFQPGIDNGGIRHAHEHVVTTGAIFLEIGWFGHLDEGIQSVGAVQSVGLEPFLSPSLSGGPGVHDDAKSARHEVLDDSLAHQR